MVSSGSGGLSKQVEEGSHLPENVEALSHALYKTGRPVAPPWNDSASSFRSGSETRAARERRASEYQHREHTVSSVFRSVGFRHSISTAGSDGAQKQQQKEGYEKQLHKVSNFSEWLQENASFSQNKSLWNWKPLRALAHIGQQRFHCIFLIQVQSINNLPASMNGLRLTVHFRHQDNSAQTVPCRVSHGRAEFYETLRISCTVYGSKKASHRIKYMSECFILSTVAVDVDKLELGKHQLELTRMLPESSDGKGYFEKNLNQTTNFYLSGKAKGGTLMVKFSYEILDRESRHTSGGGNDESGKFSIGRGTTSLNNLLNSPQTRPVAHPANTRLSSPSVENLSVVEGEERSDPFIISKGQTSLCQCDKKFANFSKFNSKIKKIPQVDPLQLGNFAVQASKSSQQQIREVDIAPEHVEFEVVEHGVEVSTLSVNEPMRLPANLEDEEEVSDAQKQLNVSPPADEKLLPMDFPSIEESDYRVKNMVRGDRATERGLDIMQSISDENLLRKNDTENSCNADSLKRGIGTFQELDEKKSRDIIDDKNSEAFSAARTRTGGECVMSHSDHEVDVVTGEFLHMLDEEKQFGQHLSNSEQNSPRASLFSKQLKESLPEGDLDLDFASPQVPDLQLDDCQQKIPSAIAVNNRLLPEKQTNGDDEYAATWGSEEEFELAAIMDAAETELRKASQKMRSKARAKMLEDAETEALMHEWGLDEKAFQSTSLQTNKHGLNLEGTLTAVPPAPPLTEGFDAVIPTRDGGSLKSMSSIHFQRSQYDVRLVMHLSRPVVVPAEMGYKAVDILQELAAAGMEQMVAQAIKAMPLDDITGKSEQQIALEGRAALESTSHRLYLALDSTEKGGLDLQTTCCQDFAADSVTIDIYSSKAKDIRGGFEGNSKERTESSTDPIEEYTSLEKLAPVAVEKIEALAIEGLKIQCGMAEEDAPYNIDAFSWKDVPASESIRAKKGSHIDIIEGVAATHLLEGTESGQENPHRNGGLMSMSIPLEEWMRLDAGVYDESKTNEKTSAILAVHHAAHNEIVPREKRNSEQEITKATDNLSSRKTGFMNNALTLAMLVQLRNPLRNYEPVGSPMMALVQAEPVIVPYRQKMWKRVSVKGKCEDEEAIKTYEAQIPKFKITGVHVSGLNTRLENRNCKKKIWGNEKQHQSGSRWLIANGMSKITTSKHPLLKSKQMPAKTKVRQGESLWSISAQVHGSGAKWPEIAALNSHIRNPNIIFTNDTIRTR
ncbi:hypothetical protein O6H91_21G038900 [Diphasiastrum complanatum]|uniref:Uncharacterized protein n=1 Tax=Diphasiastrum complanatum TaxID=34168 RepID=A0ACC2AJL8_DIPCM|nr:hypothetical protein O6H91_21G038900 [Diphasiastrum complanatum]